jgi:hypothetical protein
MARHLGAMSRSRHHFNLNPLSSGVQRIPAQIAPLLETFWRRSGPRCTPDTGPFRLRRSNPMVAKIHDCLPAFARQNEECRLFEGAHFHRQQATSA